MQGTRDKTKLWTIDNPPSTTHSLNSIIDAPTIAERIKFYTASLFSPTLSTLAKAISAGFLTTFPVFTTKQLRKFAPQPLATPMGHLHAKRSNIQSTKIKPEVPAHTNIMAPVHIIEDEQPSPKEKHPVPTCLPSLPSVQNKVITSTSTMTPNVILDDTLLHPANPYLATTHIDIPTQNKTRSKYALAIDAISRMPTPPTTPTTRTRYIYATCEPITGRVHSDQTGALPITSISGNKYIFILYDEDSNYIDAVPIPSRTKHQILAAYKSSHAMLKSRGLQPRLQRLDNEASIILKDFMYSENVDFQLTPAGIHRRNKAERAIQTFKSHFISGLCTVDPKFPLNLWDKLLPQAILTLNLLRPSNINPVCLPMHKYMVHLTTTGHH